MRGACADVLMKQSRRPSEEGISLVSVLVLLAFLSSIIVTFMYLNRDLIQTAANRVELSKAKAEAQAGHEIAAHIIRSDVLSFLPSSESYWRCRLDDAIISIAIQDEAGKVDLNGASEDLLQDLLRLYTEDATEAARAVDLIIDFRDGDDEARPLGAEQVDYKRDNYNTYPKNRPFVLTDELYQIPYLRRELIRSVLPFLTVHSRRSGIDVNYAPLPVLQAAARASALGTDENDRASLAQQIPVGRIISSPRQSFSVQTVIMRDSGFTYAEQIVINLFTRDRRARLIDKKRITLSAEMRSELDSLLAPPEACIERLLDVP